MIHDFLPITTEDMKRRGWEQPDFVYVIGDAYVDHSSFGPAIISRVLEAHGYKVAIISQPDWKDEKSITTFGEPRLGFLVSAGNMDSMVNHYTVSKKHRKNDAYTPGGVAGKRPDYATVVYCNLIKRTYKNTPIIIGGIEASLRRLGHYDYWSDKMKRSVLMDSGADLLIYGMGELAIVEVADALNAGIAVEDITFVRGTVYKAKDVTSVIENEKGICLPDFDELLQDKMNYAKSFLVQYNNTDFALGRPLIEKYGEKRYVVQNPAQRPLTMMEMDDIYELPYMNNYHPSYEKLGGVPAISEIKFSLTSNRGCYGGCSFCALTFHQGRIVQARSHESLIREAEGMIQQSDFKGYIHDVGGPTAQFRRPACDKQMKHGACAHKQCLFPKPCENLKVDHSDYISLLRKLRKLPGVKKVFVRSGVRYDYVVADKDKTFLKELCKYHVSGQLRVAPEHVTDHVLDLMGKPGSDIYQKFVQQFEKVNKEEHLNQFIVPYLISSHPGSDLDDAIALAESVRDMGYMPEQVQDFYPTPSTISTVMYYTGVDPRNMKKVYVTRNPHEKAMQRALIQYRKPENYNLVKEALLKAGRNDLIGFGPECLIPPRKITEKNQSKNQLKNQSKNQSKNQPKNQPKKRQNQQQNSRNNPRNKARKHLYSYKTLKNS
ncbi:MAG: YgiQ family radical SAM protein [Lachnospiraceae bacterium]|nr:YgiQ family radical SAM protein [Lachnospiraceae bacterium]